MANLSDRITVEPGKCGGRPCIRGLRIRVKDILDMLAGGATRAEILADYPYLENDDITAALEFASRATDHPVIAAGEPCLPALAGQSARQEDPARLRRGDAVTTAAERGDGQLEDVARGRRHRDSGTSCTSCRRAPVAASTTSTN